MNDKMDLYKSLARGFESMIEVAELGAAEQGLTKEEWMELFEAVSDNYLEDYRKARAFDKFLTW